MDYELFKVDGEVLRPSEKARAVYRIPEYWDFYIDKLTDVVDVEGLEGISKPIYEISQRLRREKQLDYLLELISIIKEKDNNNKVNWRNTNTIVAKARLYLQFLKSEIAKNIDRKYYDDVDSLLISTTMNKAMDCQREKNAAFEEWVKDKLKQ